MAYFIDRDGKRFGPYTAESLRQYHAEGLIAGSDHVRTEAMANWITVEEFLQSSPCPREIQVPSHPPATRGRIGLWIAASVAVGIVSIILFVLSFKPKPEDGFDQARMAYLNHDQANFDKYVDVQSVLSDWTDQAAAYLLQANQPSTRKWLVVQGSDLAIKTMLVPKFSATIDRLVVSGTLAKAAGTDESEQTERFSTSLTTFLSSALHTLVSSQLSYEGVASKSVSGDDALLGVNVRTALSDKPIVVKLRMHRDGDHWRVVAVRDLADLLLQLDRSQNRPRLTMKAAGEPE